jgi:Fibronectin type III domain
VPGQVTGLSTTAGNGQVTLTWQAVSDAGSPVSGYQVEVSPPPAGQQQIRQAGLATSATITGLTNGTTYTFAVMAVNALGDGPWSLGVSATPFGKPAAPAAPTATVTAAGTVTVSWAPPQVNGTTVTGYTVYEYQAASSAGPWGTQAASQAVSGSTTSTSFAVTNGDWYEYAVAATSQAGTTPQSALSTPAVKAGTPPGAPTGLTATGQRNAVTIRFTAAANTQASTIEYGVNGPAESGTITGPFTAGTAYTETITNAMDSAIVNGTPVTIYLAECDSAGQCSNWAGPTAQVTPSGPAPTPSPTTTSPGQPSPSPVQTTTSPGQPSPSPVQTTTSPGQPSPSPSLTTSSGPTSCNNPSASLTPNSGAVGSQFLMAGSGWTPGGTVTISVTEETQGTFGASNATPTVAADGTWQTTGTDETAGAGSYTFNFAEPGCTSQTATYTVTGSGSSPSPTQTTPTSTPVPAEPSGLTATAVDANDIALSWTNNSPNQSGVVISLNGQTSVNVQGASVSSYTWSGLSPGTQYSFYVASKIYGQPGNPSGNGNTQSPWDGPATATTPGSSPSPSPSPSPTPSVCNATVSFSPSSGPAGSAFVVSGAGWVPGTVISFNTISGDGDTSHLGLPTSVTTGASGTWQASGNIPTTAKTSDIYDIFPQDTPDHCSTSEGPVAGFTVTGTPTPQPDVITHATSPLARQEEA